MEARISERIGEEEITILRIAYTGSRFFGGNAQITFAYASGLLKSTNVQQARDGLEMIRGLIRDDPTNEDYLFHAALGLTRLESYEEALSYVDRCIRLNMFHGEAIELRELILARQARRIGREPDRDNYAGARRPDANNFAAPGRPGGSGQSGGPSGAGMLLAGGVAALIMGGLYLASRPDQLTRQIEEVYKSKSQTPEMYRQKMNLKNRLETVLRRKFGKSSCLYSFGSTENKMGTKDSDLDLFLEFPDSRTPALQSLEIIASVLLKSDEISEVAELIPAISVPILRFSSNERIAVDLSINNPMAVKNTYLLKCYALLDERVAPLVVVVKLWAKQSEIRESTYTLSSYACSLMVIHYLQCGCRPSVLPNLFDMTPKVIPPGWTLKSSKANPKLPQFVSSNQETLGKLLLGFLRYYSEEFDFKRHSISIRNAEREEKFYSSQGMISIEDPFSGSNVARSVSKPKALSKIESAFSDSYEKLSQSKNLDSIYSCM